MQFLLEVIEKIKRIKFGEWLNERGYLFCVDPEDFKTWSPEKVARRAKYIKENSIWNSDFIYTTFIRDAWPQLNVAKRLDFLLQNVYVEYVTLWQVRDDRSSEEMFKERQIKVKMLVKCLLSKYPD